MKKYGAVIGWSLGGIWFLFATYVSVTGGPNFRPASSSPEKGRAAQIKAAAQTPAGHTDDCCSKKASAPAPSKADNPALKSGCPAAGSGDKCSHE